MAAEIQYKNPPIVERIIGVYHQIPPEEFEKRMPSWVEKIRKDFPIAENLAEWNIDIEQKNGVPFVKNLVPKARIIRLFWRSHKEHLHVLGMRLRPDRLVFHLQREKNNPHAFNEILPEMEKWLPLWAEHFGINDIDGVMAEYYNVLDGNITPQFVDPDSKSLKIGEVLTVFGKIPGKFESMTAPYDCKVRMVINSTKPTYLDFRVRGDDYSHGAVRVDFVASTFPKEKKLSFAESIDELNLAHDVIIEQFSCVFTENAKKSFNT